MQALVLKQAQEKVRNAGYDIKTVSKELEEWYLVKERNINIRNRI